MSHIHVAHPQDRGSTTVDYSGIALIAHLARRLVEFHCEGSNEIQRLTWLYMVVKEARVYTKVAAGGVIDDDSSSIPRR